MAFKTRGMICVAVLLVACGAPKTRPPIDRGIPGPGPGNSAYHVDTAHSEVRVLVYRAGPLARLGHNHVIVNRALSGWVNAAGAASAASFVLRVPLAEFVVDDVQARESEGADFSALVTPDGRAGTRQHMLGAALLDAERFPVITLSSIAITREVTAQGGPGATPKQLLATLSADVAGKESRIVVPFTVQISDGRISASGTATLRQSDLGLTPISLALGALQVRDELIVKFKVVAARS